MVNDSLEAFYLSLDTSSGKLSMIDVANPLVFDFAKAPVEDTRADSPQMATVANIGDATLLQYRFGDAPPSMPIALRALTSSAKSKV
jgi:hypothetical protein